MGWIALSILVSLGLVVVSIGMACLGVHVASRPAEGTAKPGIERTFLLLGGIAVILILVQGMQMRLLQEQLRSSVVHDIPGHNVPETGIASNTPAPAAPVKPDSLANTSPGLSPADRRKILKQRAEKLGEELFTAWNSLETAARTQNDLDASTRDLTAAQRATDRQRIDEIERQFAGGLWERKESDLTSLIEEIDAQGEIATGISSHDIEYARNACSMPSPQYFLLAMKDCADRLQGFASTMH